MTYSDWTAPPTVFTPDQVSFISICNNVIIGISLLALLIFYIGVLRTPKDEISFSLKLTCNLFFSDLIYAVSNILSNFSVTNVAACQVEGFMKTYSLWSSITWAYIIAYVAYNQTVVNSRDLKERYKRFCLVAYGPPVIVSALPLIPNLPFAYGPNQIYCWIVGPQDDTVIVRWGLFFAWVWIIILLTTALYIRLYLYLKRLNLNTKVFQFRAILIYPVILYIALVPATLRDTGLFDNDPFPIMLAHILLLHSLGFFNCMAYGLQRMLAFARTNKSPIQESFAPAGRTQTVGSLTDLELADETGPAKNKPSDASRDYSLSLVLKHSPL